MGLGGSLSSEHSSRHRDADMQCLRLPQCWRYLSRVATRDECGILPCPSPLSELSESVNLSEKLIFDMHHRIPL